MMTSRRTTMVALVLAALTTPAHAEETPEVKLARAAGVVLADGKGHYFVLATVAPATRDQVRSTALWYGDGKTFYALPTSGSSADGADGTWAITDGRMGISPENSALVREQGAYTMTCGQTTRGFTPVADADARTLVAKAAFKPRLFNRVAIALGREGTTYYYIDRAIEPRGNQDYRGYVGKRGAMKRLKTKALAADNAGIVITAPTGSLRVNYRLDDQRTATIAWETKKKTLDLTQLPIDGNPTLIYADLGVYGGQRFGLPCDDP